MEEKTDSTIFLPHKYDGLSQTTLLFESYGKCFTDCFNHSFIETLSKKQIIGISIISGFLILKGFHDGLKVLEVKQLINKKYLEICQLT